MTDIPARILAAEARFASGGVCYYVKPKGLTLASLHRKLRYAARGRGWTFFRYAGAIGIKPREAGSCGRDEAIEKIRKLLKTKVRACVSAHCGWVGKESACLTWKHAGDERMCPHCYDNTESISLLGVA